MKNLFKLVSAIMLFVSSFSFGQNYANPNAKELIENSNNVNNKQIFLHCITYSCCGVGPFTVEIWSEKVCNYVYTNKTGGQTNAVIIDLKNKTGGKYNKSEIDITNDIIIPDNYVVSNDEADVKILKAGKYQVIDGQLAFTAPSQKMKVSCLVSQHSGHLFGHEYSYGYAICVFYYWPSRNANNDNGYLTIDLSNNPDLLRVASEHNNTLSFDEDMIINVPDGASLSQNRKIRIKAGTYKVNDDNKMYITNFAAEYN